MIKLQVIGNLGKDAELRDVNGMKTINFSVAHSESFENSKGEKVERTTWVNCTIWKTKEQKTGIVEYLTKGSKVLVEGEPSVSTYKNNAGVTLADLSLNVRNIELLGHSVSKEDKELLYKVKEKN